MEIDIQLYKELKSYCESQAKNQHIIIVLKLLEMLRRMFKLLFFYKKN